MFRDEEVNPSRNNQKRNVDVGGGKKEEALQK
jgi:hypothetical protein